MDPQQSGWPAHDQAVGTRAGLRRGAMAILLPEVHVSSVRPAEGRFLSFALHTSPQGVCCAL